MLLTCKLDDNCTWVNSERKDKIHYDITFTNGHPEYASFLTKQFSFEQQVSMIL